MPSLQSIELNLGDGEREGEAPLILPRTLHFSHNSVIPSFCSSLFQTGAVPGPVPPHHQTYKLSNLNNLLSLPLPACLPSPPTHTRVQHTHTHIHRQATSNKIAWDWVTSVRPDKINWVRKARWVHDGVFLTSSGVTAGTDAAVYAVKTLLSEQEAAAAAKRLELLPTTDAGQDPFAAADFVPPV